jgi:hypothetical protein
MAQKDRTPEQWALIERNLKAALENRSDPAKFHEWFEKTYPQDQPSNESPPSGSSSGE